MVKDWWKEELGYFSNGDQDAMVYLVGGSENRSGPAYVAVRDAGQLKLRTSLGLMWDGGAGLDQVQAFMAARDAWHGGLLRVNMVKFWADGVVETRTARMLEPYTDAPDTLGLLMIPQDELMAGIKAMDAEGFQVHVHAIGDGTVRYALDAFEGAWAANGRRDARHHINHLQFIHPNDRQRFAELGVGASFEPYWAYEDEYITDFTRPHVGPERMQWVYPMRSLIDAGATVAFSSDWSVSSADPRLGIEVAVTRVDPHSNEGEAFLPEQGITLDEAIAAYTINAAWMSGWDDVSGSIEVGKSADLVVLAEDLYAIKPSAISDVAIVATLFQGEVVYGALPGTPQPPEMD